MPTNDRIEIKWVETAEACWPAPITGLRFPLISIQGPILRKKRVGVGMGDDYCPAMSKIPSTSRLPSYDHRTQQLELIAFGAMGLTAAALVFLAAGNAANFATREPDIISESSRPAGALLPQVEHARRSGGVSSVRNSGLPEISNGW